MERYETVIRIVNEGIDEFDAGERAGQLIRGEEMTDDMVISCEPTKRMGEKTGILS